jgi:hypothetical protein
LSIVSIPYIFQAGTTIASAQVNADFASITNVINGNIDSTNLATVFSSSNLSASKGHVTFAGGLILQWVQQAAVLADNSTPATVTWDITYPSACVAAWCQVAENTQTSPQAITAYTNNVSNASFVLNALGGTPGKTVTINIWSIGF